MKYLLKEINEVLEACKQDTIIAIAFLHGLKTAIMLGLNIDVLKEINEVLEACKQDTIIAIAFLHGLKTAIMLGLNIDENEEEKKEEEK